jgi:predicted dithiol-disulfide oxidoreductase (DUF899 family)
MRTTRKEQDKMTVTRTTPKEQDAMTDHKIGSREEYEAAREELLQREKEHTRLGDELAEQRRAVGAD